MECAGQGRIDVCLLKIGCVYYPPWQPRGEEGWLKCASSGFANPCAGAGGFVLVLDQAGWHESKMSLSYQRVSSSRHALSSGFHPSFSGERVSGIRARSGHGVVRDFQCPVENKLPFYALTVQQMREPVPGIVPHLLIGNIRLLKPGWPDLF